MAESRTLFVTCHSSHERDRRSTTQVTRVCLEPEVPLQVCSRLVPWPGRGSSGPGVTGVTGGPRAGLARPLPRPVLYLSAGPVTH